MQGKLRSFGLAAFAIAGTLTFCAAEPQGKGGGGGSPPPADPAITFVEQGTTYKLKVMNADGTNLTTIFSTGSSLNGGPSWSPLGDAVAFALGGTGNPAGLRRIDISVVNGVPTGSNIQVLVARNVSYPAWSPLGHEIAFVDVNALTIEAVSSNGGVPELLYTSGAGVRMPAWDPTGTRLAFVETGAPLGGGMIRILERGSGAVSTVYNFALGDTPGFLSWSRAGDRLSFNRDGSNYIQILKLDTGQVTATGANGFWSCWSPDDSKLVYNTRARTAKIAILNLASGAVTQYSSGSWPDWRRF